ncbi:MAG TPA: cobalt-precorrin-6A reductase [Aldersonia sp.]
MTRRILVLGGTAEARALAAALDADPAFAVVSSLAGRVRDPVLPAGDVRVGGFGGVDGLAAWLEEHRIDAVVDATHPFAAGISANAVAAAHRRAVPLIILRRTAFEPRPGDRWVRVESLANAADALHDLGERAFLTIGRQGVSAFADNPQWFLIRAIDPPDPPLPRRHELLLRRGPFDLPTERRLLAEHRIDVLVSKNSGGAATVAKLDAAREAELPVVMVERPAPPAEVPTVATVAAVLEWLRLSPGSTVR